MIEQLDKMMQELADIEHQLGQPEVASDQKKFKELNTQHSRLSGIKEKYDSYKELVAGIEQAKEVLDTDDDPEMKEMAKAELAELEAGLSGAEEELQFTLVPPDPNEGKDVIVEIRAGTGGDEAALFVGDLYKMYLRYAEQTGLKSEVVNTDATGIGGFKEVVFAIKGAQAYSHFIGEGGGHRVQRIPATESGGRIHTSAATVAVLPEVEETEVEIKDADLRIDFYRSSGPGGQSVNTTDSAVRLTHVPTGIIVTCQDEKSQHKNKAKAMRIMRARVYEREVAAKKAEADASKKAMIGSGDRSQRIRTYNFPQNRITDHRIGFTSHNLDNVMAGDMSELVDAITKARKQAMLDALGESQ